MKPELTGSQVRMARAFLRWSVADLAAKANVGISTVQRIEAADDPAVRDDLDWRASARGESIQAIRETLIGAGITLLPDDGKGVGIRGKTRHRPPPHLDRKKAERRRAVAHAVGRGRQRGRWGGNLKSRHLKKIK